jgi:hypothetical protein
MPTPFPRSDLAVSSLEGGYDETTISAFRFGSFGSKLAPTDKEFDALDLWMDSWTYLSFQVRGNQKFRDGMPI